MNNLSLKTRELTSLLNAEEFLKYYGAENIQVEGNEIRHRCVLPSGMHKNGDHHPSASLNKRDWLYGCFVCGGGSILWFIQQMEECSKREAFDKLEEFLVPRDLTGEELVRQLEGIFNPRILQNYIPRYNSDTLQRWRAIHPYLVEKRGLNKKSIKKFFLGYNDKNQHIIIPHFFDGNLVGWQERKIRKLDKGPRYKNTFDFPKNETLYNYDRVKDLCRVIVVEGPLSVVYLDQFGYCNAVATFGAKVTEGQVELLKRFQDITLFMDEDKPGKKATEYLIEELKHFADVYTVQNSGGDAMDKSSGELAELFKNRIHYCIRR